MSSDVPPLDLLLVSRYALLAGLTRLIPIPILDAFVETWLRRRLTRLQLRAAGIEAEQRDIGMLGDGDAGGCAGMLFSVLVWPVRKALFYVLWVFMIKAIIDTFSAVITRSVLVHEALELGVLPGDAVEVRAAMQRAKKGVDTRPLDRAAQIVLQGTRRELWTLWRQARGRVRLETQRERRDMKGQADDRDPLEDKLERLSADLASAIWIPDLHDELRLKLRRELGVSEPPVAGAVAKTDATLETETDVTAEPDAEPETDGTAEPETDGTADADPDATPEPG